MSHPAIDPARYRTLNYAAIFLGVICALGAVSVTGVKAEARTHQALLGLIAVVCFASPWFAMRARARNDVEMLQRIGLVLVALSGLAIAEAIVSTFVSDRLTERQSVFRAHFAFLPIYYIGAMVLARSQAALKFCWVFWGAVTLVTVGGLYYRTGLDLGHDGVVGLLTWMLVGNPLVLVLLGSFPQDTDALNRTTEELGELTESERRFDLAVEGLQVGIWDLWLHPQVKHWASPRFHELVGYPPGELKPTPDAVRTLIHPEDRERVWEEGARQLERADIVDVDFRLETRHRGYRWFNSRAKAERDADGKLLRLAGAISDVHDRHSTEQALFTTQAELTRLAYRDTLTDLHNRRYFDEHYKREWERARRSRQPMSLMLVDLDHFKAYNDRYGHPAGDLCLVEIAHLLNRATSRATDIVARLGGEEFGIVLPETDADGAEEVGERIHQLLKAANIPNEGSPEKRLTLSIGYSVLEDPKGPSANELYEQADRALYEIKRRGRNGILRFWGKAKLSVVPKEGGE